ncbi:MAG: hypothetical protein N3F63_05825, partial [Thermoplasmata archaeon]|nr:hypothetical protein [Thermoplasmata archaeon]
MAETEGMKHHIHDNGESLGTNLVIEDSDAIQRYALDEIKNKVLHGDVFKVLRKIDDETFDMVFIDPPYYLQLPKKELR